MEKLCYGCMQKKSSSPVCEHCGYDERMLNAEHQLPIGTVLRNQYVIGRVLGQGGFGITYIAWDRLLEIPVAVKEFFPSGIVHRHLTVGPHVTSYAGDGSGSFEKYKRKFLKEARTLAQLSDISEIVQVNNFFEENNTAYIVMEYVRGITLKAYLKQLGRPLSEKETLDILNPLMRALNVVHEKHLIHRDISPDNIMLPFSGGIKLIDFGAVRILDDEGLSKSTEAVLKPGYAPIEQYNAKGNMGPWTDVYALCATMHYCLTGKVPADVHSRLEEGEELTVLRNQPGISQALVTTLEKGMTIRSSSRIQNVKELYSLLYGKQQAPVKKFASEHREIKPVSEPMFDFEEKTVPVSQRKKDKKFLMIGAAAAALVLGCTLLIPRNTEKPSEPAKPDAVETAEAAETQAAFVPETAGNPAETVPQIPETIPQEQSRNWEQNVLMHDDANKENYFRRKVFDIPVLRQEIKTVTILDYIPDVSVQTWDVSADQSGRVIAWVEKNGDLYDLYIAADGGINAAGDACVALFDGYTNMENIEFNGAFHTDYAESMVSMFGTCSSLKQLDVSSLVTSNVVDMQSMFAAIGVKHLDLSTFDTGKVKNMSWMFGYSPALTVLDLSGWDTASLTNMESMFMGSTALRTVDFTSWDTSNVTNMYGLFRDCTGLEAMDLTMFDTSKVTNMSCMFFKCNALETLELGNWEVDSVKNMGDFYSKNELPDGRPWTSLFW